MKRTKRICFLGKGGIGKSVITANVSAALAKQGYKVLQVGNDISLSSTLLLRGEAEVTPALEEYRKKYTIKIEEYIIKSPAGAYCLELGSLEPGVGCMARGIHIIDEMLESQGTIDNLGLDYILYDISGDIPCTGFILPMRDGVMQKCIVVTNSSIPALVTANSMIAGIVRASKQKLLPIGLLVNFADVYPARPQLTAYAEAIHLEEIAYLDYFQKIEHSELAGKTVLAAYPDSAATEMMMMLAKKIIEMKAAYSVPKPLERKELLKWLNQWKQRSLAQKSGIIGIDDSSNI